MLYCSPLWHHRGPIAVTVYFSKVGDGYRQTSCLSCRYGGLWNLEWLACLLVHWVSAEVEEFPLDGRWLRRCCLVKVSHPGLHKDRKSPAALFCAFTKNWKNEAVKIKSCISLSIASGLHRVPEAFSCVIGCQLWWDSVQNLNGATLTMWPFYWWILFFAVLFNYYAILFVPIPHPDKIVLMSLRKSCAHLVCLCVCAHASAQPSAQSISTPLCSLILLVLCVWF